MHNEIELTITGLVYNQTIVGTYGLVMSEVHGNRRFSVMIGEPEAQSIAMKLNNKKSPRPLTHDLINNILKVFGSSLEKIVIYNMLSDVFYSELHIKPTPKQPSCLCKHFIGRFQRQAGSCFLPHFILTATGLSEIGHR